jgi:hypothetical protein
MVNLEWYRTFKSVYKNGNFSVAANELFISQPAVSQQIAMLEAHVGYKLFNRKSKGVEPTEYAKLLNNLIIEALDRLENVEQGFREKAFQSNKLVSVGISKHYFSSIGKHLIRQFDFIDFTFAENDELFVLVNEKKIERKSFINTRILLFQLLTRRKYPCKVEDFNILKTLERLSFHDEIIQDVFHSLSWNYTKLF